MTIDRKLWLTSHATPEKLADMVIALEAELSLPNRNLVAEIISINQACGSCADAPPYCAQCLEEADIVLAEMQKHPRQI